MSQLDEIINQCADDKVGISSILRKCLILASDIDNSTLGSWATQELNGYKSHDDLPEYRRIGIQAKGHFDGSWGKSMRNVPLPGFILSENLRWWAETAYLLQPVGSYEPLLEQGGKKDNPQISWPQDMVAFYQSKFYEHFVLTMAWQEVPYSAIVGLIEGVRNRTLSLALDIRRDFGSEIGKVGTLDAAKIERAVQYHIYGGNQVFADSASNVTFGNKIEIQPGDFQQLKAVLVDLGIANIDALQEALDADKATTGTHVIGEKTGHWLKQLSLDAAKSVVKGGVDVAKTLATKAILAYAGLA